MFGNCDTKNFIPWQAAAQRRRRVAAPSKPTRSGRGCGGRVCRSQGLAPGISKLPPLNRSNSLQARTAQSDYTTLPSQIISQQQAAPSNAPHPSEISSTARFEPLRDASLPAEAAIYIPPATLSQIPPQPLGHSSAAFEMLKAQLEVLLSVVYMQISASFCYVLNRFCIIFQNRRKYKRRRSFWRYP